MSPGLQKGQLAPRAVPLYNALHLYLGPLVLAAAIATGLLARPGSAPRWPGAPTWPSTAHRLRPSRPDGFQRA